MEHPSFEVVKPKGSATFVNMLGLWPHVEFALVIIYKKSACSRQETYFCFSATLDQAGQLKLAKMDDFDKRALSYGVDHEDY